MGKMTKDLVFFMLDITNEMIKLFNRDYSIRLDTTCGGYVLIDNFNKQLCGGSSLRGIYNCLTAMHQVLWYLVPEESEFND